MVNLFFTTRTAVLIGLLSPLVLADDHDASPLDTPADRAAYGAGYQLGKDLRDWQDSGEEADFETALQGIRDALAESAPLISEREMQAALAEVRRATAESTAPQQRARRLAYKDDFAALNAERPGVTMLPSGVQYEVLEAADGARPEPGDTVLTHFVASLSTGEVIDSTDTTGEPERIAIDAIVVPGLREALLLMPEGARWRIVVPPRQGFGRAGNNRLRVRDLIYDLRLIAIENP